MTPDQLYGTLIGAWPALEWDMVTEKVWLSAFEGIHPVLAEKSLLAYNTQGGEPPNVAAFLGVMETIKQSAWEDIGYTGPSDPEPASLRHFHIAEARAVLESLNASGSKHSRDVKTA